MKRKYDVAAYIWPAYCKDERTNIFWPEGIGEWQSVKSAMPKFDGHSQPRIPLWGYVNEADHQVMEMQIEAATRHGVNVFVYDWYWYDRRPFLEKCLNEGFLKAKNRDKMKFYLMWANHDAVTVWDKRLSDREEQVIWQGAQDRKEFEIICHRIIKKYFSVPNYYTIDNQPVFSIYDLDNLIIGLGGIQKTRDALEWFREQTKKAGFAGLHLQCILRSHFDYSVTGIGSDSSGVQQEVVEALGFDSLTHYQYCHVTDIGDYDEMVEAMIKQRENLVKDYKIPYFPHVSVGWDNNPRFFGFRSDITIGNTPDKFEKALQESKKYLDKHKELTPLITINSWNEWTETSYLEPDTEYGYAYLEAVQKVFASRNEQEEQNTDFAEQDIALAESAVS